MDDVTGWMQGHGNTGTPKAAVCANVSRQASTCFTLLEKVRMHVLYTYLLEARRAWLGAVTPSTPEGTNATTSGA